MPGATSEAAEHTHWHSHPHTDLHPDHVHVIQETVSGPEVPARGYARQSITYGAEVTGGVLGDQEVVLKSAEASARFRFWETPPEGGAHYYSRRQIQPIQYIEANELPYHEAAIVKYLTRWAEKNGIDDLRKALFFLNRLIQLESIARGETDDSTR